MSFILIAIDQVCRSQSKWPLIGWRTHFLYCIDMHECFTGKYTTQEIQSIQNYIWNLVVYFPFDVAHQCWLFTSEDIDDVNSCFPINVAVAANAKEIYTMTWSCYFYFVVLKKILKTLSLHLFIKKYIAFTTQKKFISLCCQRVSFICYN